MVFDLDKEYFSETTSLIHHGMTEILSRFELPVHPEYGKSKFAESSRFFKKNSNRYFRKHLGFTFRYDCRKLNAYTFGVAIKINDIKKFLVFCLKYEIILHEMPADENESKDSGKTKK
jgi:hypothetical protein